MSWRVIIREQVIGATYDDGRLSTSPIVGDNQSDTIDNTTTKIVVNPALSRSVAGTLVGSNLTFTSGPNNDQTRTISSYVTAGGYIVAVVVGSAFPGIPDVGNSYTIPAISSGIVDENAPAVQNLGNRIVIAPGIFAGTPDVDNPHGDIAEALIGQHIIFISGSNTTFGDTISGFIETGGFVVAVGVPKPFGSSPTPGDTFIIVQITSDINDVETPDRVMMLDKQIENINFSSSIDEGYADCTVTLNERIMSLGRLYDWFPGRYMEVYEPYGMCVWAGIITGTRISGLGGTISAIGERATLSWYYATDTTYADEAATTAPKIIKDVLATNPFFQFDKDSCATVDPLGVWNAAQVSAGGIGPRFWNNGDYTAADIIENILDMGYYHMGAEEGDKVVVQVWDRHIPYVRHIPRVPNINNARWLINNNNFNYMYAGVALDADISDTEALVYATYTDEKGESIRTPGRYTIQLIRRLGLKGKAVSAKDDGSGSAYAIQQHLRADKSQIGSPGSMNLTGRVKSGLNGGDADNPNGGGSPHMPVYFIKAGDIIAFEGYITSTNLYQTRDSTPGVFVVGSTSYNVDTGVLTITADKPLRYRDLYNAGVNTGKN